MRGNNMKILIACEFSGIVRDAFVEMGHDAMSCDFLPTERHGKPYDGCINGLHYKGNVMDILDDGWDMMIAFPPCTFLCSSGLHWNKKRPERTQKTEMALLFVEKLMNAPIEKIAIENPIGCISSRIRKPDQIIQPFQFGHPESKSTCLWLKNLPKLIPTKNLEKPECGYWENQTPSGQNKLGPSEDRWKERSKTYQGIAQAMANQWG
jgi:hypothetical protein